MIFGKKSVESVPLLITGGIQHDTNSDTFINYEMNNYINTNNLKKNELLRYNFIIFTIITSINRACDNLVISYYTALLGKSGSLGLGILFISQALTSLLLSKAITKYFGCKNSITVSHIGFSLLCLCFFLSIYIFPYFSWPFITFGSIVGGASVAIWWTAQSEYYSRSCDNIYDTSDDKTLDINAIRSDLASYWTILYLGLDMSFKLLGTVVSYYHTSRLLFTVVTAVAALATIAGIQFIDDLEDDTYYPPSSSSSSTIASSVNLKDSIKHIQATFYFYMTDPRIQLISIFFMAYGTCQAMLANYIDGDIVVNADALGVAWIGVLAAISTFVAATSAPMYNLITKSIATGKHMLVLMACSSFVLSGLLIIFLSSDYLSTHFSIIIFYKFLWGLCRGVYENTFKVVLTDIFVDDNRPMAFSVQVMILGIFCSIFLFIFPYVNRFIMAITCTSMGLLAMGCYVLGIAIHNRRIEAILISSRNQSQDIPMEGLLSGQSTEIYIKDLALQTSFSVQTSTNTATSYNEAIIISNNENKETKDKLKKTQKLRDRNIPAI